MIRTPCAAITARIINAGTMRATATASAAAMATGNVVPTAATEQVQKRAQETGAVRSLFCCAKRKSFGGNPCILKKNLSEL